MPDPIPSEEEHQALLRERLSDPLLDRTEKAALRQEHEAAAQERADNQAAQQATYDAEKGKGVGA